jgi:glycerophosphoryl diester phosphodiesterase
LIRIEALGSHLLEMDVHLAACGKVVVSHDRHLVRPRVPNPAGSRH